MHTGSGKERRWCTRARDCHDPGKNVNWKVDRTVMAELNIDWLELDGSIAIFDRIDWLA